MKTVVLSSIQNNTVLSRSIFRCLLSALAHAFILFTTLSMALSIEFEAVCLRHPSARPSCCLRLTSTYRSGQFHSFSWRSRYSWQVLGEQRKFPVGKWNSVEEVPCGRAVIVNLTIFWYEMQFSFTPKTNTFRNLTCCKFGFEQQDAVSAWQTGSNTLNCHNLTIK